MLAKPTSDNATALLSLLTTGRDNGTITEEHPMLSRNIAALLNFDAKERAVRECVHELRLLGYLIASGDKGYFLAKTGKQIIPTIKVMLSKAKQTRLPAVALMRELELEDQLVLAGEFE